MHSHFATFLGIKFPLILCVIEDIFCRHLRKQNPAAQQLGRIALLYSFCYIPSTLETESETVQQIPLLGLKKAHWLAFCLPGSLLVCKIAGAAASAGLSLEEATSSWALEIVAGEEGSERTVFFFEGTWEMHNTINYVVNILFAKLLLNKIAYIFARFCNPQQSFLVCFTFCTMYNIYGIIASKLR